MKKSSAQGKLEEEEAKNRWNKQKTASKIINFNPVVSIITLNVDDLNQGLTYIYN